jgi:hypothetical protein
MSATSAIYVTALETITRWADLLVPKNQQKKWVPALSKVTIYWYFTSSKPTQQKLIQSLLSMKSKELIALLRQIGQDFGAEAMFAAHKISCLLATPLYTDEIFPHINTMLVDLEYTPLKFPQLSLKQRVFGSAVIDRILGISSQSPQFVWEKDSHTKGPLALLLIGTNLSQLERVCFSTLMLDALAQLHVKRLMEQQGFAPEKIYINHRFELVAPESRATQLKLLHSPERNLNSIHHMTADVWAFARFLFPVLTGKSINTPLKDMGSLIPPEVLAPLKRSLAIQPENRFYSGRELRVVLAMPFTQWIERLTYENGIEEEQEDHSLPYEELEALREYELKQKIKKRRINESKLQNNIEKKMMKKQQVWVLFFALIGLLLYIVYQQQLNAYEKEIQKVIDEKIQLAHMLYEQDQAYQNSIPKILQATEFHWRFIADYTPNEKFKGVHKAIPPLLVSESEVTEGQYKLCVKAGKCSKRSSKHDCQIPSDLDRNLPVTCITFKQARSFARFVGGDLPTLEQWKWIAFEHSRLFPWGHTPQPNKHYANLRHQKGGHAPEIAPVCTHRHGDSPKAICDLVGNVHEWVILDEFTKENKEIVVIAGLIGGGWFSIPKTLQLYKGTSSYLDTAGYDVGFRVVKILTPQPLQMNK